jgi:hypothetical protein
MPAYYFHLNGQHGRFLDPDGIELHDHAHAREYARQVALELMQGRETRTRSWRLKVLDASKTPIFELLFATVDPLLARLPPNLRMSVERVSAQAGDVRDAIIDVRDSLHRLRSTLAKANGEPYLASLDGTTL